MLKRSSTSGSIASPPLSEQTFPVVFYRESRLGGLSAHCILLYDRVSMMETSDPAPVRPERLSEKEKDRRGKSPRLAGGRWATCAPLLMSLPMWLYLSARAVETCLCH